MQHVRYIMKNVNIAKIITEEKRYEIQSPDGVGIIVLIPCENRLNTLKEILIMYSIGRFCAQHLHGNI